MRKINVFNNVSLEGFFTDHQNDMSWAHKHDEEWKAFTSSNAGGESELLLGRVTYELMASFWPTPLAAQMLPEVAERMNAIKKIVVSRAIGKVTWENTTVIRGDLVSEVRKLKEQSGPDIVILGSGSIVSQLAAAGLIDSYQVALNPIVVGRGRTMFESVPDKLSLRLTGTRAFGNGNVVLWYEPA